jgi:hypothetical protein
MAALLIVAATGCNSELTDSAAPVALIVSSDQDLARIDLNGGNGCDENLGTFTFRAVPKNSTAVGPFVDVRITRYRVSYRRIDGGTQVPASFVVPVNFLVSNSTGITFRAFATDSFSRAPFVSLFPSNGGRDPETGRPVVRMETITEFFGETLAGDAVYAASSDQLDFCFNCGGCL